MENTGLTVSEVFNHHSDHDQEHSNPIFSQDAPAYNYDVHQTKFGGNIVSSCGDTVEISYFGYMSPHCDLDHEVNKAMLPNDTLAHHDAPSY